MSFAAYQGQAQELEALRAEHERERERQQAAERVVESKLLALLPFLGDDIFVLIATELDAR
eukprot:COSAG04_NODE_11538_length_703_cov_1.581126_2_plen_60_part_01